MPPQEVDVLIIGGGSAGLCAGVWLARNGVSYRILERRGGKLTNGQADGVQVRTVEVFESFGISEELLKDAYHVLEDAFWSPANDDTDEKGIDEEMGKGKGIRRTHATPDTEAGLSHMPHVILNQARINALLTNEMERASGSTNIEYGCDVRDVVIDCSLVDDPDAHCVAVTALKNGVDQVYRAKYVLVSDFFRLSSGFSLPTLVMVDYVFVLGTEVLNISHRAAMEHIAKSVNPLVSKW
jgi:phenol 2-monooxygenase